MYFSLYTVAGPLKLKIKSNLKLSKCIYKFKIVHRNEFKTKFHNLKGAKL